jgi:uncharacterized protein
MSTTSATTNRMWMRPPAISAMKPMSQNTTNATSSSQRMPTARSFECSHHLRHGKERGDFVAVGNTARVVRELTTGAARDDGGSLIMHWEARVSPSKETVQRYMEAYGRWDHAEVLACLTDDVEWIVPGAFRLEGREAFDNEIEGQGAAGPPEIVVTRLVEEDDVVVAEGTVRNALEGGGVLSLVFCDVFLMRNGLIRQVTSYLMAMPASTERVS